MADEILIVEDDDSIRRLLRISLKTEGYRVSEAKSATVALSLFEANAPVLVLLDLGLPDRDGMEVLAGIRSRGTTPVIVVTARSQDDQKVAALDAGADDYVVKPFSPRELVARVKAVLGRTMPRAEAEGGGHRGGGTAQPGAQQPGGRGEPPPAHVGGERGQVQAGLDPGTQREGAQALGSAQQPVRHQAVDRLADGGPDTP